MKFVDLAAQQLRIRPELNRRIAAVLDGGAYVMGPEVGELETALSRFVSVKNVISCSSGTDALLMALMAKGVGVGDAVITTPFTFVATAEVISLLGATPVFVDIDAGTFNMEPSKIEAAIKNAQKKGLKPKAIIPVDMFGLPADYDSIGEISSNYRLFMLEDGCQGFGGVYKGKKLCRFGDAAATSFYPAKPLGCYGDGGAVFTDDDVMAEKLRSIRIHGMGKSQYDNIRVGITGRMDSIQAAVLLAKMEIFDDEIEARGEVAMRYTEGLLGVVETPVVPNNTESAWAQYSVLVSDRDIVRERLSEAGIPTAVYYPKPLHLQTAYQYLGYREGDFPVSEKVSNSVFSLPMHPYLSEDEIERVVSEVKKAVK